MHPIFNTPLPKPIENNHKNQFSNNLANYLISFVNKINFVKTVNDFFYPAKDETTNSAINAMTFANLPNEIQEKIARELPIKDLNNFKLVNRHSRDIAVSAFKQNLRTLKDKPFVLAESTYTRRTGKLTELLINYGLDINSTDEFGNTALFSAVQFNCSYTAQNLINLGININHTNNDGDTAFHKIMYWDFDDNTEILSILINNGADVHIPNNKGETAIYLARTYNCENVLDVLAKNKII